MRTCVALLVLLLLAGRGQAEEAPVPLEAGALVQGIRLADVDGDGLTDVLLVEGRRLRVFRGRRGTLPEAKATWERAIPATDTFLDVRRERGEARPTVLVLGTQGVRRLPLAGDAAPDPVAGTTGLTWFDTGKAAFARLARRRGLVLPGAHGWTWLPPDGGSPLPVPVTRRRTVRAPGPFLEDTCAIEVALPEVFVGRPAGADAGADAVALWTIDGTALVAQVSPTRRVRYDLGFLGSARGSDTSQKLVDLDADGRPELVHRIHTNLESRYGFFRTRATEGAADVGPTLKPATSTVFLPGYQDEPDFVDLDGDGLLDLVVTNIQVDGKNTLRALGTGTVTAETHAFLNRWRTDKTFFRDEPDATVKSDIGVEISFNYAGTLEIRRSFTILLEGDYDGDGRRDLAIRTSADQMTIWAGAADGVWAPEGRALAIPPMGTRPDADGYTADLDGDGKDEIVLRDEAPPGGQDRAWVIRASR